MNDTVKTEKKDIGYAFRIGGQISTSGISFDITGNFAVGTPDDVINVELDKWIGIVNRQRTKDVLEGEKSSKREDSDRLKLKSSQLALIEDQMKEEAERESTKSANKAALENMRMKIITLKQEINEINCVLAARESGIESLKNLI